MQRFSVFRALPSATLRVMASRQLVVSGPGWAGLQGGPGPSLRLKVLVELFGLP